MESTEIFEKVSEVMKNKLTKKRRWYSSVKRTPVQWRTCMLNEFFVNVAQNLNIVFDKNSANSFDSSKLQGFVFSTIGNFVTQFNIPHITVRETQKSIENLSSSKVTGADDLSVKILKLVSLVFVQPLTRLINLSIQKSRFPSKWKLACVTLLLALKMALITFVTILDQFRCSP